MRIGDLARRAGINAQTVRYYERIGLLPAPPRERSGYRRYDEADAERVGFITKAKQLGITLQEIGDILRASAADSVSCEHVLAMLEAKRDEIARRIDEALALRDALDHTIRESRARLGAEEADGFACPIIERGLHERALHLEGVAHAPIADPGPA